MQIVSFMSFKIDCKHLVLFVHPRLSYFWHIYYILQTKPPVWQLDLSFSCLSLLHCLFRPPQVILKGDMTSCISTRCSSEIYIRTSWCSNIQVVVKLISKGAWDQILNYLCSLVLFSPIGGWVGLSSESTAGMDLGTAHLISALFMCLRYIRNNRSLIWVNETAVKV